MKINILNHELRYCGFCKKELKFQMKIYKTNVEGLKEVKYCVFCDNTCEKKRMILEDKVKRYNKKLLDIDFSKYLQYEKMLRQ
jgi:hypothetical protein